jgi:hypothetical protein
VNVEFWEFVALEVQGKHALGIKGAHRQAGRRMGGIKTSLVSGGSVHRLDPRHIDARPAIVIDANFQDAPDADEGAAVAVLAQLFLDRG